ncbi:hypothetical protein MNJPNG_03770 [Cupriavidus oxalaticus]
MGSLRELPQEPELGQRGANHGRISRKSIAPYKADQYKVGTKYSFGISQTLVTYQIAKYNWQISNNVYSRSGDQRGLRAVAESVCEFLPRASSLARTPL